MGLDGILIALVFVGFAWLTFLILFLERTSRRYYRNLATEVAYHSQRSTLLLLGKIDETTDASAMTLSETNRTARGVTETKQIVKDTKTIVEDRSNAFH